MIKNLGNIFNMLGEMKNVRAFASDIKTNLSKIRVESEVAGGAVNVTADGNGKIINISIDPDIDSKKALEGLLINCINDVSNKAKNASAAEVAKLGKLNFPEGMDKIINNFM